MSSSDAEESFSDAAWAAFQSLSGDERDVVAGYVASILANPEVDGINIFDLSSMVPIMLRVYVGEGFRVTFRMQNRRALIYAITRG